MPQSNPDRKNKGFEQVHLDGRRSSEVVMQANRQMFAPNNNCGLAKQVNTMNSGNPGSNQPSLTIL